jgi:hypothetical protein
MLCGVNVTEELTTPRELKPPVLKPLWPKVKAQWGLGKPANKADHRLT